MMFKSYPFLIKTHLFFLLTFGLFVSNVTNAQNQVKSNGIYLGAGYGIQLPVGELSDRFGSNNMLAGQIDLINSDLWVFSTSFNYMFGSNINEAIAGGLVDDQGRLINTALDIAEIDVKERGFAAFARVGRIMDLWSESNISGLKWSVGVGFLQHKVKLADSQNAVPYFEDKYVRGYDRLTNGLALSQFIGYQFLDNRGRLNFYGGFEAIEGFTKNRRGYNYNTRSTDDGSRLDMLLGFKVGIQITIKSFKDQEDVWY